MWKYIIEPDRPQKTIWRMRIVCQIPKATNTLSEYVIRNFSLFTATIFAQAPQCSITRTLPILLLLSSILISSHICLYFDLFK